MADTPSTSEFREKGVQLIKEGTTAGCLKSDNYPQPYGNGLLDEVIIPTRGFKTLELILVDFQVGSNSPSIA